MFFTVSVCLLHEAEQRVEIRQNEEFSSTFLTGRVHITSQVFVTLTSGFKEIVEALRLCPLWSFST